MNSRSYSNLALNSRWALFLFACLFARAAALRTPVIATTQTACPAVQFQTPRSIAIPDGQIQSVTTPDVNNDGRADVLALSASWLEVLLNDGAGNLLPPRRSNVASDGPIATADVNGDGRLDLALVNRSSGRVSVSLGDGTGNFAAALGVATLMEPYDLVAGDFTADGKADLAVVLIGSQQLAVLPGNGDGTFSEPLRLATGRFPQALLAGDFNGDGREDLVAGSEWLKTFTVFFNGNFSAPLTLRLPNELSVLEVTDGRKLSAGDFNGDGKPDLIVTQPQVSSLIQFMNQGNGTFSAPTVTRRDPYLSGLLVADFFPDGRSDLVLLGNYSFQLWRNSNGAFEPRSRYSFYPTGYQNAASADFDNDGLPDLLLSGGASVTVLRNQGAGVFGVPRQFTFEAPPVTPPTIAAYYYLRGLKAADLNNDGRMDLVSTTERLNGPIFSDDKGYLASFINQGNGESTQSRLEMAGRTDASEIALADFDGDRRLDVAALSDKRLIVLRGDGQGGFNNQAEFNFGAPPASLDSLTAADFNAAEPSTDELT